ncbi:MAG: 50S ribosomal protein L25 [Spirochaetaceae bacterium]|jgi:large subunit ribosomal protein L25|nr:50S ribosomal protein L25 [Spirochaetaceae bacterium]
MANVQFAAKKREASGSAAAARLRRTGRIPAVIYGHNPAVSIDLDEREFVNGIKGITESTIVKVNFDGTERDAFVKTTQRNITSGKILHVDFYEIETGKVLRTKVSVRTTGNPIGVRDGGILETPLREIEVECLPADLPPRIVVDISGLRANQAIHVGDLSLGSGVKLVSAPDKVIALVKFARQDKAQESEEIPAEGAAAPADEKTEKAKDEKK